MKKPGLGTDADLYLQRGVSARKPDVQRAIANIDPGLFPGAFCKAIPDYLAGSPEHCVLMHSDGAGTKSSLAYVQYCRTGDARVFRDIAQDSLVMNLDDLLCVGATGPFLVSNTIGRNLKRIPGEAIKALIEGYEMFADKLAPYGVDLRPCGGETADLGDLVRTIIADSCITVRMRRDEFIDASKVKPGHVIVGMASAGQATYEDKLNSGAGTNGFTALRHSLFGAEVKAEFPESFAPEISDVAYLGSHRPDDPLPGCSMTLIEACLCPTRTYAPIVLRILASCRPAISAIFHNTGGGQTKCLGFGSDVHYVKENLMPLPPLFAHVRTVSGMKDRELLQVFNMGHRVEVVCDPGVADEVIGVARSFEVDAQIIGRVESGSGRSLTIAFDGSRLEFVAD
ncbi:MULTISPECIES: AIR synthase related protein [unclassified Mesorhizobium]|uniref:AIR synthase related protein n=1 Tax=unclassified Mesorhizobium TaxID=325217 RepID=UPI001092BD64|nr:MULTISPECIES: AIR synthase related protein [unclassified Mesorhizobium]TGP89078.1 phosphoribosylformylglycinamidine cyclo-ligase [Mesorhizobium sp. M8A.F.Ca.ET.218.01.1.1]TGT16241.1 phosphoribosylformylglycinamidine cyclo-ligase [Mesorhizobium sp. M8A.F.Ca.ET.213.01.1.1]